MPQRRRSRSGIRWDRLGRVALLMTLVVIVLSYASPARKWIKQSGTAGHQAQELGDLQSEKRKLDRRLRALRDPEALEREARRMGMIRVGERSYVIENLP